MRATAVAIAATISFACAACGSSAHQAPPAASAAPASASVSAPAPGAAPSADMTAPPTGFATTAVALPGGGPDGIAMDYLLYNPRTNAVWAPAGNTGMVDVVDVATGKVTPIAGFATQEIERRGVKRKIGPSAAALGEAGTVYVGNRGNSSICAVDERSLAIGACGTIDSAPDGVLYVAATREVWVTAPRDRSLRVLDARTLAQKARIELDGAPEGFAVDNARGRFYTNLEDKDVTLAIDLASRKVIATWKAGCGEDGPRGLRLITAPAVLLVACTARLESLDVAHDGAQLGSIDTGEGVDDFDYSPRDHRIYIGAAKAARLTVATLDDHGGLAIVASTATAEGARNGVVTGDGRVYLSHSKDSELIVVAPRR